MRNLILKRAGKLAGAIAVVALAGQKTCGMRLIAAAMYGAMFLIISGDSSAMDTPPDASLPLVELPRQYIQPAPQFPERSGGRESPQALLGTSYTIIHTIFDGEDGTLSYIRFRNRNSAAAAITVTVVGNTTGRVYGSVLVTVPPYASPQYSYGQIIRSAGVSGYIGNDDGFSFYLRSSAYNTDFQHVIHNSANKFFENMTTCYVSNASQADAAQKWLSNVHTTSRYMTDYPSVVVLHHYGDRAATYQARVFRSTDGAYLGGLSFIMEANETFVAPMSWYERGINWTPADAESHANIYFELAPSVPAGTYRALVAQGIYNASLDAYLNMTSFCSIEVPTPPEVWETEPNGTQAQANSISYGTSNRGQIATDSDEDWFKVTVTAAGVVDITLTSPSTSFAPNAQFIDARGNIIASSSGSYLRTRTLQAGVVSGTYYIRLTKLVFGGESYSLAVN